MREFKEGAFKPSGLKIWRIGLAKNSGKVQAITELQPLTSAMKVRQIIGMASWYRYSIQHFAGIVKPLNYLLRKETKWELTVRHHETGPVLQMDASDCGVGVLWEDPEEDECVIANASRTLIGRIIKYGIRQVRSFLKEY